MRDAGAEARALTRAWNGQGHRHPCRCPNAAELLGATMAGRELAPTCLAHHPDAVKAHEAQQQRAAAQAQHDETQGAIDEVKARWAAEAERAEQAQAHDARERWLRDLGSRDPIAESFARVTGAQPPANTTGNNLPLNAPLSAYPALGGMTEANPRSF